MNIAIVGCGYVGMAVARRWRESGHVVTATTTTKERVPELEKVAQRVVVAKGNDEAAVKSIVRDQDVVLLSVGDRYRTGYEETYLGTAKTLVEALDRAPSVKQVIYTGSYAIYGDRKGEWVNEETPAAPANQNYQILYETEQILLGAASEDLRVCILRLGGIYGPGRELVKIYARIPGTTLAGEGEDFANWIHLDDIVEALEFARFKPLQGIYNLVNDVPLPRRELLARMCDRYGWQPVSWDASVPSDRPYNVRVSNEKIKAAGYPLIHRETML